MSGEGSINDALSPTTHPDLCQWSRHRSRGFPLSRPSATLAAAPWLIVSVFASFTSTTRTPMLAGKTVRSFDLAYRGQSILHRSSWATRAGP